MRLSSLIPSNDSVRQHGSDVDIAGITADSRLVEPGYLFIAIPGTNHDGRLFIKEALARGAAAVLTPMETALDAPVTQLTTTDVRQAVSDIAARFYPHQPEIVAAVTGTSGKTSTAQFLREVWASLSYESASIGTLGFISSYDNRYGSLTTPDAITLHQLLSTCVGQGITHVVMEASSHGLALHRLDNVQVKVGGFTNLSRDHLDYHETMENYLRAKLRLFDSIIDNTGTAVVNADSGAFDAVTFAAKQRGLKIISYGQKADDIKLLDVTPRLDGQILKLELFGKKHEITLPVLGMFQAWNALCALGMAIASGAKEDKALSAIAHVTGVPGRLQLVGHTRAGSAVFVDYAHKPDALENVLDALRPHVAAHTGAKLGVVFGCGGNRDRGKRPLMGGIAQRLADWVIVTDDNPRHEEPSVIRREILAGCKPSMTLCEIGDRTAAIKAGIAQLNEHDVLVIAGKGHESGQIVGDVTHPFDDADIARKFLR